MAVTLADVAIPNRRRIWAGVDGDMKYVVKDVTFDNSYSGTADGEVVTAAQLGYRHVYGGVVLENATTSDNESMMPTQVSPNSTFSQVAIQLYRYDGASAGKASLEEAAEAFDASGYTARIKFLVA